MIIREFYYSEIPNRHVRAQFVMSDQASRKYGPGDFQLITCTKQPQVFSYKQYSMQRLPPEIITNIICYLEAEDTESLRRLSKSWKSASETSNTKHAILRHFPRSSCPALSTGLQYNLLFRRLCKLHINSSHSLPLLNLHDSVYQNSSLKRGRVTRSHYFSDVSQWSLRSNKLVVMRRDNRLLIYDLTSRSGNRLEAEHCVLKSIQELPATTSVVKSSVSLGSRGEIMVCCSTWRGMIFAKISTDLTQQWSVTGSYDVAALGTDRFYGLVFIDSQTNTKARLVTRRFDTEAEISDIPIAGSFPHEIKRHTYSLEATMTSNEQIFVLKNHSRILGLVDVLSGEIVYSIGAEPSDRVTSTSIFLHPGSPDFRISQLEIISKNFKIYDYVYDAGLAAYNVSLITTVHSGGERYPFSAILAPDLPNDLLIMRRGHTDVKKHEGTWEFIIKKSRTWMASRPLTIPLHKGRACLLVPRPKRYETRDSRANRYNFLGMVDGYLVYHDAACQTLMVADFWPSW